MARSVAFPSLVFTRLAIRQCLGGCRKSQTIFSHSSSSRIISPIAPTLRSSSSSCVLSPRRTCLRRLIPLFFDSKRRSWSRRVRMTFHGDARRRCAAKGDADASVERGLASSSLYLPSPSNFPLSFESKKRSGSRRVRIPFHGDARRRCVAKRETVVSVGHGLASSSPHLPSPFNSHLSFDSKRRLGSRRVQTATMPFHGTRFVGATRRCAAKKDAGVSVGHSLASLSSHLPSPFISLLSFEWKRPSRSRRVRTTTIRSSGT